MLNFVMHEDIDAGRGAVWRWVANPTRYPEFFHGLTRWAPVGEIKGGVGDRFRMHLRIGPAEIGELVEVVEVDPLADIAWVAVAGIDHRGRWRLRTRPDGATRAELRMSYASHGGLGSRLADLIASPIVERHFRKTLAALKQQVEHASRASSDVRGEHAKSASGQGMDRA